MAPLKRLIGNASIRRVADLLPPSIRERVAAILGFRTPEDASVIALRRDVENRLRAAARDHEESWRAVRTLADWERFRDERIEALRRSLGSLNGHGAAPSVRQTGERRVDGVVIENLVIEQAVPITANLYRPASTAEPAPTIVICHSHHADKTQGELQDMGLTWAEVGCVVLVADVIGHGERRLHPFSSASDYRLPYKVSRQDYLFRFNLGWQLELAGRSLMGWMVADVKRAIDVLVERPEVDPERLLLVGSVAGGADIASVAAALDGRARGLVSFGYQGGSETGVTDRRIPGAGRGSWELSRNLPRSACDGFLPWIVLAARAPLPLVYAHEFSWDPQQDPVWTRLRRIYELYDAADQLAAIHGRGSVTGPLPHNTHCTNVGAVHRRELSPILERWFDIPPPQEKAWARVDPASLHCLEANAESRAGRLAALAEARIDPKCEGSLRERLEDVLGIGRIDSKPPARPASSRPSTSASGREIVQLTTAGSVELRLELLWPGGVPRTALPLVVGFCQHGARTLGRKRRSLVRTLRDAGVAVCLTDLRATGPASGEAVRGRQGLITEVAASELMLGRTLLGQRLADLRDALDYLRDRPELRRSSFVLWGDSLAPVNPPSADLVVPFDAGWFPERSEPLGGLVALLAGVVEPDILAVVARGAWLQFASLLEGPLCYTPADAIAPGMAALCEIDELAAAQRPRPLLIDGLVDGLNRAAGQAQVERAFRRSRDAYESAGASKNLVLRTRLRDREVAGWILDRLPSRARR